MVDVTIGDLTAGGAVSDADLLETQQAGATAKITAGQVFTYINGKTFTSPVLQRYSETVATGSASLDRADGGIQTFTMTANITLSVAINAGESLTFHLSGGDTYTVTWPTITWVGGSAPTLTSADVIEFWKVGSTLYGAYVGSVA